MSFNICRGTLGRLAMFTAIRNASSRVSSFALDPRASAPTKNRTAANAKVNASGLRHHVRRRMLAAVDVIIEQRLHLGHALADFPDWVIDHPFLRVVLLRV